MQRNTFLPILLARATFVLVALATSPEEVSAKLSAAPQALALDGLLFPGPEEITTALADYRGVCVVTLPPSVDPEAVAHDVGHGSHHELRHYVVAPANVRHARRSRGA